MLVRLFIRASPRSAYSVPWSLHNWLASAATSNTFSHVKIPNRKDRDFSPMVFSFFSKGRTLFTEMSPRYFSSPIELGHVDIPNYKKDWETEYLKFPCYRRRHSSKKTDSKGRGITNVTYGKN